MTIGRTRAIMVRVLAMIQTNPPRPFITLYTLQAGSTALCKITEVDIENRKFVKIVDFDYFQSVY